MEEEDGEIDEDESWETGETEAEAWRQCARVKLRVVMR